MMIVLLRCRWVFVVTRLVVIVVVSNPIRIIMVFKRMLLAHTVFDHLVRKAGGPGGDEHHRKQGNQ